MSRVELGGKVAIVTGASSGIGRATALALARHNVRLALASRSRDALRAVADEARGLGTEAFARPTDVTVRAEVEALVEEAVARLGPVDVAVCGAGEYVRGEVGRAGVDAYERSFAANFYGSLHLIRAVLPAMAARRTGHIVVISTVDAKKPLPLDAPYVAAKSAITGVVDVLRQELRGTGVRTLTVLPGRVDTPMIVHLDVPWVSRKIPAERVARAVVRGLRRGRAEVVVPWLGPKSLIACNALSPRLADWLVRALGLEGVERADPR